MTQEAKILSAIGAVTLIIIIGAAFFLGGKPAGNNTNAPTQVVDADINTIVGSQRHTIGEATTSAKVTLVEFADFQCPACRLANPLVEQIVKDYQGKIFYVYRDFLLPQHLNAVPAARAAEAAGAQGKFWEMKDLLYEKQDEWGALKDPSEKLNEYAQSLGLDMEKFKNDYNDNRYMDEINKDKADGNKLGVNSTPSFFINNKKVQGLPSYEEFKRLIDEELKK